ncbi:hypothetical protein ABBQ38_007850 [Trebouxia sp. C0009 RCD-2024]
MDAADGVSIDPEPKQTCRQHRLRPGGHHLAVRLTSGLKAASNKTENLAKTKPAQLIGAAVLGGCLVIALSLFRAKKPPRNNNTPASSPQMGLAWHWARFKDSYMADDDDSCSTSCHHLRVVQAAARQKDAASNQELYHLGVLQFLVHEMKGNRGDLHGLKPPYHSPNLLTRTSTGSKSPSPDRINGRLSTLKNPGSDRLHHGNAQSKPHSSAFGSIASPERSCRSASCSPSKRIPTLPTMEEMSGQAEAADRAGALHVPASAPTSSADSSPRPSARRALSLAASPSPNRSPIVSPSKLPLASLPHQSPLKSLWDTAFASKLSAAQLRPPRQSSRAFHDENRPVRVFGSPGSDSSGLGLPAGFQTCGDLNEDVAQWEGQEKEHGPPDEDVSSDDSTEEGSSCFTSPERLLPSPKPLTKRFPSIPPLSGHRGLASAAKPPLPATPLRQLQITSPDREGLRGRIYKDPQRHLLMIQLALEMLLTQSGDLDPVYIKSLSEVQHLSVIQQHLSTERNAGLAGALQAWAAQAGEPVMRLLRLTSRHLFNADQYKDRCQIARGAFSVVFDCCSFKEGRSQSQLAMKVSDLPSESRQNEKAQITAFTEIGVMQRLAHMPGICQLHDYGINRQGIYLVMTRYTCSLRSWLAKQTVKPSLRLRLYMDIFCQLADLLKAVADQDVVHFDLKCDNILLEALPGISEEQFWQPTTDTPPFKVVLADFGDSCDFSLSDQKFTTK